MSVIRQLLANIIVEDEYYITRSSGPYGPFLLAPAEGIGGPFGPSLGAFWAPITSQNSIKSFLHKQMTEKITYKSWAKKLAKNVKNCFFLNAFCDHFHVR